MCHTVDMTSWDTSIDAATCVDWVMPETWRQTVKSKFGLWPVGVIADRVFADETARYVPFSMASSEHLAAALTDEDVDPTFAAHLVAAAWWGLHLAGQDTTEWAVLALARKAITFRAGYLAGQLNPLVLPDSPAGLPVA